MAQGQLKKQKIPTNKSVKNLSKPKKGSEYSVFLPCAFCQVTIVINRPHFVLAKVIAPKQKTLVKQKQITKVRTCCEDVNGRPVLEFDPL
jgi:hypothetical protein